MINVLDDAIGPDTLDALASACDEMPWRYGWHSTKSMPFSHWNHEIVKGVSNRNVTAIVLRDPYAVAWRALARNLPENAYPIRCYANLHTYGVEGYPHSDSQHVDETTAIVYLNRDWKREWGGETAFYDGHENVKSVMPKFGRVVMFPSNVTHCARSVSRICPKQRVTFILKARHPQSEDTIRLEKFLTMVGAGNFKHKHGSLRDHLIRVQELLKGKNVSRSIALAGGLHSIYGTNSYLDVCVHDRQSIVNEFGAIVDALVYQFSQLQDRPTVLEWGAPLVGSPLCWIEAANLKDQGVLGRYRNLHDLWTGKVST